MNKQEMIELSNELHQATFTWADVNVAIDMAEDVVVKAWLEDYFTNSHYHNSQDVTAGQYLCNMLEMTIWDEDTHLTLEIIQEMIKLINQAIELNMACLHIDTDSEGCYYVADMFGGYTSAGTVWEATAVYNERRNTLVTSKIFA